MGYQQKVAYHLEKALEWQQICQEFEQVAESKAAELVENRDQRYAEQDPGYIAKTLLQDSFRYKSAVASRNSHQAMIQMYGMAHLVAMSPE